MEDHYQFTDNEFETQFALKLLPPKLFTHEAHLRLAWIHIKQYGLETASDNLCKQIKAYAESLGEHQKFNTTVTIAAVNAVHHFAKKFQKNSFKDFIKTFPRLKADFKGLMDAHYSIEIFENPEAKVKFIEPDLLPFD